MSCAVIGLAVFLLPWFVAEPILPLADQTLSAFRGKPSGWMYAESVELDPTNPKKLLAKPGKGILVNAAGGKADNLVTHEQFGDVTVALEFLLSKGSNSGLKFHAHYEIQLLDSFGKKDVDGSDCGGIYPRAERKPKYHHIDKGIAPKVNACKAPGEWQTLEVTFLAPRFDGEKKIANAKIVKAVLNGRVIHENVELLTPTGHNWPNKEVSTGALLFQGDHGPTAFRNIRITPN